MKWPGLRFSLSTLLIGTVFIGSVLGCWLRRSQWVHEYELPATLSATPNGPWNDYLTFNKPGDKLCVYRGCDNTLELFDLSTKTSVWRVGIRTCYPTVCIQFVEDKELIALGAYASFSPDLPTEQRVFNAQNGKQILSGLDFQLKWSAHNSLSFSSDRVNKDKTKDVKVWGTYTDKPTVVEMPNHVYRLRDYSPDIREWAIPSPNLDLGLQPVCRIQHSANEEEEIQTEKPVAAARYSENGQLLALLDDKGVISIWSRNLNHDRRRLIANPFVWISILTVIALLAKLLGSPSRKMRPA